MKRSDRILQLCEGEYLLVPTLFPSWVTLFGLPIPFCVRKLFPFPSDQWGHLVELSDAIFLHFFHSAFFLASLGRIEYVGRGNESHFSHTMP